MRSGKNSQVSVEVQHSYPADIDHVAEKSPPCRNFLRSAWYSGGEIDGAVTLVARTGDGVPFAALPTETIRPFLPWIRAIAGSYWPFRTLVVKENASPAVIRDMVAHPHFRRTLSPLWRMGPVYADDPSAALVLQGARDNGWQVLTRNLGATYRLDIADLAEQGKWPRKSTMKRLRGYERQLMQTGTVRYETISGSGWTKQAFALLADIEKRSWVGRRGEEADAKFLPRKARNYWKKAVRDPAIAGALSATIVYVDDKAIAFSFDLRSGDIQYSIASSYDEEMAVYRPGKIITYHQFQQALADGVRMIDLGAGDNGYKREMGALPQAEIHDYLVVRRPWLARFLRRRWER